MAKISRVVGTTSQITEIFVLDSTSTTGAGKTGLTNASVTCYYKRNTGSAAVSSTVNTIATLGTYAGSATNAAFKEVSSGNMPGLYEFQLPDNALASGADEVVLMLTGSGIVPVRVEIELTAVNNQDATKFGMTRVVANSDQIGGQTASASGTITFPNATLASTTNITAGTITTTTNLTNAATSGDFTSTMKTSLNASTPASVTTVTGNVNGNVGGSVASVTARVTANTDQLAGQTVTAAAGVTFPTSVASPTNITAGTITTVTNLTNAPTVGDFTSTMKTSLNASTPASVTTVTGNVNGNVAGSVGSVTAGVTVTTNNDKTGYSLTQSFPANFAALGITAGGKISGVALTDTLTTYTGNTPQTGDSFARLGAPVGASISADVAATPGNTWDVTLASHVTAGSTGFALNAAGSAGDPWGTALPGAYSSGTAGFIVGTNLNATVSSRLPTSSYVAPDNATITAINAKTTNLPSSPAATGAQMDLVNAPNPTAIAAIQSGLATSSSIAALPTDTENADALLVRNLAGGSNGGRTVQDALRPLRNKVTSIAGTLTVYEEDDSTPAWTATLTTDVAAEPIVTMDPA